MGSGGVYLMGMSNKKNKKIYLSVMCWVIQILCGSFFGFITEWGEKQKNEDGF